MQKVDINRYFTKRIIKFDDESLLLEFFPNADIDMFIKIFERHMNMSIERLEFHDFVYVDREMKQIFVIEEIAGIVLELYFPFDDFFKKKENKIDYDSFVEDWI